MIYDLIDKWKEKVLFTSILFKWMQINLNILCVNKEPPTFEFDKSNAKTK